MSVREEFKRYIRKDPDPVWYHWLVVALGLLMGALGIAGTLVADSRGVLFSFGPDFIFLGFAIMSYSLAEVLPVHRQQLAGPLRIASLCGFISYIATVVIQVLSTGPEERYYFGGIFGIIIATVITIQLTFYIWGENQQK